MSANASLTARQRGARTQRLRTRERLIKAAIHLIITDQSWSSGINFLERVAAIVECSVPSVCAYFPNKNELLWAAYDRLLKHRLPVANKK